MTCTSRRACIPPAELANFTSGVRELRLNGVRGAMTGLRRWVLGHKAAEEAEECEESMLVYLGERHYAHGAVR